MVHCVYSDNANFQPGSES